MQQDRRRRDFIRKSYGKNRSRLDFPSWRNVDRKFNLPQSGRQIVARELLGGNRWTIIELVSHLVRAVARERGRTSAENRAAEADKSAFEIPIRSCPPRYEL